MKLLVAVGILVLTMLVNSKPAKCPNKISRAYNTAVRDCKKLRNEGGNFPELPSKKKKQERCRCQIEKFTENKNLAKYADECPENENSKSECRRLFCIRKNLRKGCPGIKTGPHGGAKSHRGGVGGPRKSNGKSRGNNGKQGEGAGKPLDNSWGVFGDAGEKHGSATQSEENKNDNEGSIKTSWTPHEDGDGGSFKISWGPKANNGGSLGSPGSQRGSNEEQAEGANGQLGDFGKPHGGTGNTKVNVGREFDNNAGKNHGVAGSGGSQGSAGGNWKNDIGQSPGGYSENVGEKLANNGQPIGGAENSFIGGVDIGGPQNGVQMPNKDAGGLPDIAMVPNNGALGPHGSAGGKNGENEGQHNINQNWGNNHGGIDAAANNGGSPESTWGSHGGNGGSHNSKWGSNGEQVGGAKGGQGNSGESEEGAGGLRVKAGVQWDKTGGPFGDDGGAVGQLDDSGRSHGGAGNTQGNFGKDWNNNGGTHYGADGNGGQYGSAQGQWDINGKPLGGAEYSHTGSGGAIGGAKEEWNTTKNGQHGNVASNGLPNNIAGSAHDSFGNPQLLPHGSGVGKLDFTESPHGDVGNNSGIVGGEVSNANDGLLDNAKAPNVAAGGPISSAGGHHKETESQISNIGQNWSSNVGQLDVATNDGGSLDSAWGQHEDIGESLNSAVGQHGGTKGQHDSVGQEWGSNVGPLDSTANHGGSPDGAGGEFSSAGGSVKMHWNTNESSDVGAVGNIGSLGNAGGQQDSDNEPFGGNAGAPGTAGGSLGNVDKNWDNFGSGADGTNIDAGENFGEDLEEWSGKCGKLGDLGDVGINENADIGPFDDAEISDVDAGEDHGSEDQNGESSDNGESLGIAGPTDEAGVPNDAGGLLGNVKIPNDDPTVPFSDVEVLNGMRVDDGFPQESAEGKLKSNEEPSGDAEDPLEHIGKHLIGSGEIDNNGEPLDDSGSQNVADGEIFDNDGSLVQLDDVGILQEQGENDGIPHESVEGKWDSNGEPFGDVEIPLDEWDGNGNPLDDSGGQNEADGGTLDSVGGEWGDNLEQIGDDVDQLGGAVPDSGSVKVQLGSDNNTFGSAGVEWHSNGGSNEGADGSAGSSGNAEDARRDTEGETDGDGENVSILVD